MNGLRPDVVLLHPQNGVVVVEVKDWSEEQKFWHDEDGSKLRKKSNDKIHTVLPHPIDQITLSFRN